MSRSVAVGLGEFSVADKLLEKEFVNGSEFFLTKDFPVVAGFTFPPNFHIPFPPVCFHSL